MRLDFEYLLDEMLGRLVAEGVTITREQLRVKGLRRYGIGGGARRRRAHGDEDRDGDDVPNNLDNCPSKVNSDQADLNNDGFGDACVDPTVTIPPGTDINPTVEIGANSSISSGVTVGADSEIGSSTTLQVSPSISVEKPACVAAFRPLWTCFPRAPAGGPLHSDAMGAAE